MDSTDSHAVFQIYAVKKLKTATPDLRYVDWYSSNGFIGAALNKTPFERFGVNYMTIDEKYSFVGICNSHISWEIGE